LPPPPSAGLSRAPSVAPDRWPLTAPGVSILPEPVERPLPAYLHKRDPHYNRVVPDWFLQYRTAEQQYLVEGDFAVFVREITEEGLIVQDSVTGIIGFLPQAEPTSPLPEIGSLIPSAKCTHFDTTVVMSPDVRCLRLQTGIVYEWNEQVGEGYIIPTEGQDSWRMLRVLRRDVQWHDSRRLFVGQFVQFETALPDEVPIDANDEPLAPFALRVRSPEVLFELRRAERHLRRAERHQEPPAEAAGSDGTDGSALAVAADSGLGPLPPASGRPGLPPRTLATRHPVLQRFAAAAPTSASAESPMWLWEAPMKAGDRGAYGKRAPIVPLQLQRPRLSRPPTRILTHEVAAAKGELWREPAQRQAREAWERQKPPGRREIQEMAWEEASQRDRAHRRERRRWKLRAASLQREDRRG